MSKTSDSEDDGSEPAIEMYLHKDLKYKVGDSSGKEKPRPFFKSNQHKSVPIVGQTKDSKHFIYDILHSLNEMPDPIEVSNYPTLLHFGMGLATIEGTELARSSFRRFKISDFGTNWSVCEPFFWPILCRL